MRDAFSDIPHYQDEPHARGDGFIVGAVLCAAVVVALFALHGAPNLLGDRFNADAITYQAH
ncbi:MAG: hypothetical protein WDM94_13040 [Bauldia sp.]